jgi:hypothetical protein
MNEHKWKWNEAEELWVCERCPARTVINKDVWQRRKGAHWRRVASEPIPPCFAAVEGA